MKKLFVLIVAILICGPVYAGMLIGSGITAIPSGGSVGSIVHTSTQTLFTGSLYSTVYTATAGTARYAHVYVTGGTSDICISLRDSSGVYIRSGTSSIDSLPRWVTVDLGSFSLSAVDYHLAGFGATGNVTVGAEATGTLYAQSTVTCIGAYTPGVIDALQLAILIDDSASDPE